MHWDSGRIIGEAQRLTESANRQLPFSFHPGGKHLVFTEDRPGTILDVMLLPSKSCTAKRDRLGRAQRSAQREGACPPLRMAISASAPTRTSLWSDAAVMSLVWAERWW
jgi:hypothetical protein